MRRLAVALALFTVVVRPVMAGAGGAVFHGYLQIVPVRGHIDPDTGIANLKVREWLFLPTPESNGVFPEREDVAIELGEGNRFTIPAGLLKANKSGKRFLYRPVSSDSRGVRSLRLVRRDDGWYRVRFRLTGLELQTLLTQYPACMPMGVLLGDDHGFSGVDLTRRSFTSPLLRVKGDCPIDDGHHGHPG